MPGAAATLAALREVAAQVGPGWLPGAGPAPVFTTVSSQLARLSGDAATAWRTAGAGWSGDAADAAGAHSAATVAALEAAARQTGELGVVATRAAEAVARAKSRLRDIVSEFEARASAIDPDAPGAEAELAAAARRALDDAQAVVDELRGELDGHAATVTQPAATVPASIPAGAPMGSGGGWSGPGSGLGSAGGLGSALGSGLGSGSGGGLSNGLSSLASHFGAAESPRTTPDAATFGDGVAVRLPDGSTDTAPNAVAASAVRHALTQLGVPYRWGGTTPGVGLDCSGLTQWAYHEAGLDLPRLAQAQDVGAAVPPGGLRPGDLAVWDGHVAMIVGNGMMVEAGDPVKLSPIRTDNAGQGFQGFWRPTA